MIERKVIKALPSSFVAQNMKIATDRGSGEAKLWVGQISNEMDLDAFFTFNDDSQYTYSFSRENLITYLWQVKFEYAYQKFNHYKNISLILWNENLNTVKSLPEADFCIKLKKFVDSSRYYVRADEDIFRRIFRNLAVPKLTNIVFVKDSDKKSITMELELNTEYDTLSDDLGMDTDIDREVLNHNLYGIHIKNKNDALSEERPHVCIGWSLMGDLTSIETKAELEDRYDEVWPDAKPRTKGQDVGQIWRFIKEVQEGDYIIFADDDLCHIGRIDSEHYYDNTEYPDQTPDYVNVRNVQWLKKNIKRSELSGPFHRSLMTAMSIWRMNVYRAAVVDLLTGNYTKDDDDDDNIIKQDSLIYKTDLKLPVPLNRIVFGAPGTGKSWIINEERKKYIVDDFDYERVTFHPDYSYANFVGTYKPVPSLDADGKESITYKYVPGPFMRIYVKALKNAYSDSVKPFLLIIEEINRANVAAVFGEVFQLLDRDEDGVSEYPIEASEDIKNYLVAELGGSVTDYAKIKIPNNMLIWATMNSADQGVFPMDTAFKRRWDFTYLGINDSDADIQNKTVVLGSDKKKRVEWNKLRKAINSFLAKLKINEDKQLGPYFIARKVVVPKNGNEIDSNEFVDIFKNKVIMYLFEDAAKQKRETIFAGCGDKNKRYSDICKEFDRIGIGIFNDEIQSAVEADDMEPVTNQGA